MAGNDDTQPSFPTYAELTQTQGWAGATAVPVAWATAAANAEQSSSGRYREAAVLGVGGMGKVLLAHDARIGRDVAVKVLHVDRELEPQDRERFLREAQVQGQLEHPSIVPVYDIDRRDDGTTFFTMRRVIGRTLGAILDDLRTGTSKYTQRELLQAFVTICLTIDYAHTRGVVHRDLKPANLMLGDFGEVYVLDWGLARILDGSETSGVEPASRLSMPGVMMGTPLYMAPEQMADPDVGIGADIFALGAILFEILTLEKARDVRALYAPIEARASVRAPHCAVAPELETVCVKATQMLVSDRYPTARALQEAVARYLEGDRELEQRRQLAAAHAERAREAVANAEAGHDLPEAERAMAMRELVRALSLEPTNREHVAMFATVMSMPPRTVPPEVKAKLGAQAQEVIRFGARYCALAMLSWFMFLPIVLAVGVRRVDYLLAIMIPAAIAGVLGMIASRQRAIGTRIQVGIMLTMMIAAVGTSRMFGPLILVPTILATWAIVVQAHPERRIRMSGLVMGLIAITAPLVLEWVGILSHSYLFPGDGFFVLPQMNALPAWFVLVFLGAGNILMAVLPALFVGRLRGDLAHIQERELVRSWQLRQLGDDLMKAAA
ncbi:MAG: serine/threonine protein kinase [Deltaproteobacteria bacterium]|nr:serine/threonine protein kinase [Deltaproteobacteria bacterium]